MITDARAAIIAVAYLISAVLFIFGLKRLSSPATARHGNRIAILAMTIAVVATLLDRSITWKPLNIAIIVVGTVIGAALGVYFARTVQMTAMPQMVALFNGMGGGPQPSSRSRSSFDSARRRRPSAPGRRSPSRPAPPSVRSPSPVA